MTPIDTHAKLSATAGAPVADLSTYWSLAGALQYLTLTRPDLAYAVQQVCHFMHDPREPHLSMIKQILRYLRALSPLASTLVSALFSPWSPTPMSTGLAAPTLGAPPPAIVSTSVTI